MKEACIIAFRCLTRSAAVLGMLGVILASGVEVRGQTQCGGSAGPDVIVGDLGGVANWGTVGDITAFSIGTTSCNVGDEDLLWISGEALHPVIGQNMYRLKGDRMQQIGMSWLKHGFFALSLDACDCGCNATDGTTLGVGCSDPYSAGLNGDQQGFGDGGLGPRFEVNATTGEYNYPYAFQGVGGNAIFKRLQVHNEDLDPALNVGALYFVEGHYVTPDDAEAGNKNNNASYQRVIVNQNGSSFTISLVDTTEQGKAAVQAWADEDSGVIVEMLDDPEGGRFILASKCSLNIDKTVHYEYALQNLNSHRSARSFRVPIPAGSVVTNTGFHDVDYHSGEPYDGTDWPAVVGDGAVTWSTDTFTTDENANALRWGTTYNFGFDLDTVMETNVATVGYFRPGIAPNEGDVDACTDLSVSPNACIIADAPGVPLVSTHAMSSKNRYLSLQPANSGLRTALRVTLVSSEQFPEAEGAQWWIGKPDTICENGSQVEPPCNPVQGTPSSTFLLSSLACDPHCTDWGFLATQPIHIADINIVPDAVYEVQTVACGCDVNDLSFYSVPLPIATSRHGDAVSDCSTCPCGDSEGALNIVDCSAVVARFVSSSCAPLKSRVDLEPAVPDQEINITDVLRCIEAFQGLSYTFPAPVGCFP